MAAETTNPINPTDQKARHLGQTLLASAKTAALAVLDPETGAPVVSRIAIGCAPDGTPMSLISTLSQHTKALDQDPRASLLVGEVGGKGDPLTHPRLTLAVTARFVARDSEDHDPLRRHWLRHQPKAKLYVDFADFRFVRFQVSGAALNGGFGKAYNLTPSDLGL